ncbi:MAG TPA: ribonuclease H-like domain-containing protein [Gemmatimonadaceae bacterium]|nr:ribonuclease H-like domain-containing protein [Gemmatimonadaceae bacterium]
MTTIYLDIETCYAPDEDPDVVARIRRDHPAPEVPSIEDLRPPKSYKDEAKIAAWREARHAELVAEAAGHDAEIDRLVREWWQSTSLEPLYGRVLCVGIAVDDRDPVVLWEPTEVATLERLEAGLSRYPDAQLIAHNGLRFDYRFVWARAVVHGLYDLARRVYAPRPWGDRVRLDTLAAWQGADNRARGSLRALGRALGVELPPDDLEGADVPPLWHEHGVIGHPERDAAISRIRQHVISDVIVLREIADRLRLAGAL